MSFLVTVLQFLTGSNRLDRPYEAMVPEVMEISDTNEIELRAAEAACAPHMGLPKNGWMVGMEAFASPI